MALRELSCGFWLEIPLLDIRERYPHTLRVAWIPDHIEPPPLYKVDYAMKGAFAMSEDSKITMFELVASVFCTRRLLYYSFGGYVPLCHPLIHFEDIKSLGFSTAL